MTKPFKKIEHPKIDKIIVDNHLTPVMNNKKWVKVIKALVDNFQEIKECQVKLIWEKDNNLRRLKIQEFISYNFDYYDTSMEAMISGNPKGWYDYKEIEWLDFPRKAITYENLKTNIAVEQNLELIKDILGKIGIIETKIGKDNLRLFAYLRRPK